MSVCDVTVWVLSLALALSLARSNFCRIKSTNQIFIIHLWSTNTLHDILSLSLSPPLAHFLIIRIECIYRILSCILYYFNKIGFLWNIHILSTAANVWVVVKCEIIFSMRDEINSGKSLCKFHWFANYLWFFFRSLNLDVGQNAFCKVFFFFKKWRNFSVTGTSICMFEIIQTI